MPYVTQAAKDDLHYLQPRNVGELTYRFTQHALNDNHYSDKYRDLLYSAKLYVENKMSGPSFQHHAEVLGALTAARLEIARRLDCCSLKTGLLADAKWALENAAADYYEKTVGPYEDGKIKSNGDVTEIAALISMPRIDIGP